MQTKTKHTPLPWELLHSLPKVEVSHHAGNGMYRPVADCLNRLSDTIEIRKEDEANAAFIAHACNSHYELVAQLKRAQKYLKDHALPLVDEGAKHADYITAGAIKNVIEGIGAALAKATGSISTHGVERSEGGE